jgi:c-di-GMP-related signal transduction protein
MGPISTDARAGGRAKIGRRSIHDRPGNVVGYELIFRPGSDLAGAPISVRDHWTTKAITTAFGGFGLNRLGEERYLYFNATRALITGEVPMPFGPQNVVLEVVEDLVVDDELVAGLQELKQREYLLAIDGQVAGPAHANLLPMIDVIKLDVVTAGRDLEALADYVRDVAPQAALMAERVDSPFALELAINAGFDLFQGDHFARPVPTGQATVSPSQTISLQLLSALSSPDTSVAEVEQIVSIDPGLSLHILGTVNSAAGAGRQITSMSQAIVMMGRRSLSAWVMLAALGGTGDGRRQDMIDVLTRARTCELLAPLLIGVESSTAYTVGMLDGVVEVMGADPISIARGTRLDAEMTAALVERTGQVGRLLAAIKEFEESGAVSETAEGPRIETAAVSWAHLHALGTAVDTIDGILGRPTGLAAMRTVRSMRGAHQPDPT